MPTLTYELFRGENLVLSYDRRDCEVPSRLYLGNPAIGWYFFDLKTARDLRDALDDGIAIMEGEN